MPLACNSQSREMAAMAPEEFIFGLLLNDIKPLISS